MHLNSAKSLSAMALIAVLFAGHTRAGSLNIDSPGFNSPTVDLSAGSPLDWVHYGNDGLGSGAGEDRKAGANIVHPITANVPIHQYDFSSLTSTWSDGTPNVTGSVATGIFIDQPLDDLNPGQFTLLIDAVPGLRHLEMYFTVQLRADLVPLGAAPLIDTGDFITATLGDGSAPPVSIAVVGERGQINIDFASDTDTTLTVNYTSTLLTAGAGGGHFIALDAVRLTGAIPEPASASLALLAAPLLFLKRRRLR